MIGLAYYSITHCYSIKFQMCVGVYFSRGESCPLTNYPGPAVGTIMIFTNQDQSNPVGAQLIGAPPIYRPIVRRCAPKADKSAVCTINRHLRQGRCWS